MFPILQSNDLQKEIDGSDAYSQLDASFLPCADCEQDDDENDTFTIGKHAKLSKKANVRKRPSVAQFINNEPKKLENEYENSLKLGEFGHAGLTNGLKSHSLRCGAAQWAASHPKIAIQWICTSGLSKAFAYIGNFSSLQNTNFNAGTTLHNDQRIAKRLSGWDPDDIVIQPNLLDLLKNHAADIEK
ncbi:hypothetical protein THRCLA_03469 [Thraustotheca clavata]|uniref:Uncharacterized protein n=1 Tax=Thraustotheca clavata TaxID=74557 RepID=A0A1W0A279_9STRA|nr:hypothetical protein THRCLA_03469 [Thraustotheca clavata]